MREAVFFLLCGRHNSTFGTHGGLVYKWILPGRNKLDAYCWMKKKIPTLQIDRAEIQIRSHCSFLAFRFQCLWQAEEKKPCKKAPTQPKSLTYRHRRFLLCFFSLASGRNTWTMFSCDRSLVPSSKNENKTLPMLAALLVCCSRRFVPMAWS